MSDEKNLREALAGLAENWPHEFIGLAGMDVHTHQHSLACKRCQVEAALASHPSADSGWLQNRVPPSDSPRSDREGLEAAIEIARRTPFRAHAKDDVDFHSGCVQTRDGIVDAIRAALAHPSPRPSALNSPNADKVTAVWNSPFGTKLFNLIGEELGHELIFSKRKELTLKMIEAAATVKL